MPSPAPIANPAIDPRKFRDPLVTMDGRPRAHVELGALKTLWFNTGTLCNLTCATCYIGSSPTNDSLVYLTLDEIRTFLDEINDRGLATEEIGFTGGEPFMNPDFVAMVALALDRGFRVLVLTNAMRPIMKVADRLRPLAARQISVPQAVLFRTTLLVAGARGPRLVGRERVHRQCRRPPQMGRARGRHARRLPPPVRGQRSGDRC